jgi:hypothetical protein
MWEINNLFMYYLILVVKYYKSCVWKKYSTNHHQNVIQFNKIQKTFIQIVYILEEKYI